MYFHRSVVGVMAVALLGAMCDAARGQAFGRATFGQTRAADNLQVPSFGSFDNQPGVRRSATPGNLPPGSDLYQRPTVNPFLRLLNSPTPTSDFFTIVRPEQEFRRQANEQARELQRLNRINQNLEQEQHLLEKRQRAFQTRDPGIGNPANPITGAGQALRPTGHGTTFGNTFDYFPGLP